jgi:hypothetical protein
MISECARRTAVVIAMAALSVAARVPSASAAAGRVPAHEGKAAATGQTITIRGHGQALHLYGARGGRPVIVSSGDGGWIHLGPHVADVLSASGFFVVGFDAKAYLESFTGAGTAVGVDDVPRDYRTLIDFAARETGQKPILAGVSEGAGLSVLAATDPANKERIGGVIGLGLSDLTELGWRWKDMVIYVTHGVPHEPTFSVKAVVERVAPVPLAAIHSTRDEYVPLPEVQQVLDVARQPKRLWVVSASDHRFSGNVAEFDRALLNALTWIADVQPGVPK